MIPFQAAHTLRVFYALSVDRPETMNGPGRIGHLQIMAWQSNMGVRLTPFEIEAVMTIDRVWHRVWHGVQPQKPVEPEKKSLKQRLFGK